MITHTILTAHYQNGRWGTNCASVRIHDDGRACFCNGFGDPLACADQVDAEQRFYRFLADHKPADTLTMRLIGRDA